MKVNDLGALAELSTRSGSLHFFRLDRLERAGLCQLDALPFSLRVLLEAVLRQVDGRSITTDDVRALAAWTPRAERRPEVPFLPARVLMQDFTGVPAIVDLAAMRAALSRLGGDPARVNPRIPVDLVVRTAEEIKSRLQANDFFLAEVLSHGRVLYEAPNP